MSSIVQIHQYLTSRLSSFQVDSGTITEIARDLANLCGIRETKQYRVEFVSKDAKLETVIIYSADGEVDVYKKFYERPEYEGTVFIKAIPIE